MYDIDLIFEIAQSEVKLCLFDFCYNEKYEMLKLAFNVLWFILEPFIFQLGQKSSKLHHLDFKFHSAFVTYL